MKFSDLLKSIRTIKSQAYSSGLSRGVCLILIFTSLLSFSSCKEISKAPQKKTYYDFFDTVCVISYYGNEGEEYFEETVSFIEGELEKYHRLFDAYHAYAGMSNLYTVNSAAGVSPVTVDPMLIRLIEYGKQVYELTDGEVNICFGAVTFLWKTAKEQADTYPSGASLPTKEELEEAERHTSPNLIVIDESASSVYLSDPLASLDVGSIGKGFAAERIAEALKERGDTSFVLDLGGNIRAVGSKPDGSGWITGIEDPHENEKDPFAARIELKDRSCVTSGDYRRYFTVNGKNYHHIIDRDTLFPAEYFSSVTVTAADSALCDALSTALFCMPLEDGRRLIESIDGAEALWIATNGEVFFSSGFTPLE